MRHLVRFALLVVVLSLAAPPAAAADLGLIRPLDGTVTNGQYGIACAVVGDMDGDGFADFAIAASADSTGGAGAGRVFIYRGGPHLGEPPALVITGLPGDLLGSALAAAGDLDGDGLADLAIGAPAGTSVDPTAPGRVLIVFGSSVLGSRPPLVIAGPSPGSRFGAAVSGIGLWNGDAYPDLAVGAPDANAGAGVVEVFPGGPGFGSAPLVTLHGRAPGDNFGAAVAGTGRPTGSAFTGLLVGAPFNSDADVWAGRAYLYLGGAPPDSIPDAAWSGAAAGDFFGTALAGAGDVNGDGFDDLLIGAPGANVGTLIDAGRAYLYLGGPSLPASATVTIDGDAASTELGLAVAGVGDVNGDGRADFVVGEPGSPDAAAAGEARFFYGRTTPVATADSVLAGEAVDDMFGRTLSGGGAVLAGSRTQFLVGSYAHAGSGRAYLYGAAAGVLGVGASSLARITLAPPRPSPSPGPARIDFELPTAMQATLEIVDVTGRRIATLLDGPLDPGRHEIAWPPGGDPAAAPGIYWALLEAGGKRLARKLVLVAR